MRRYHNKIILSSEWGRYNARHKKKRRAVLAVLPFADFWVSGSRYPAITIKLLGVVDSNALYITMRVSCRGVDDAALALACPLRGGGVLEGGGGIAIELLSSKVYIIAWV